MIRFLIAMLETDEDCERKREEQIVREALDPYQYALGAEEQELPSDVPRIPWKGSLWP